MPEGPEPLLPLPPPRLFGIVVKPPRFVPAPFPTTTASSPPRALRCVLLTVYMSASMYTW
jgi:hypothetical protein